MSKKIAVIGGGAWGTALTMMAARAGHQVTLVCRDPKQAHMLNETRQNERYLPGMILGENFSACTDPLTIYDAEIVILAVPAQSLGSALPELAPNFASGVTIINTAKGIELASGKRLTQVIADQAPEHPVAVLSGPSFAVDVARGLPAAVTIAARHATVAVALCQDLSSENFRCYASEDVAGVELGGALKNVYAIAAGVVEGLGLGDSAKAALITRSFVEMGRIAMVLGADRETLMGLSGFGDLLLTCASPLSRNHAYGIALSRGELRSDMPLAEGVATAEIVGRIAVEQGLEAPILTVTRGVLSGAVAPADAARKLLDRPIKAESQ